MSEGNRSGVNWMRERPASRFFARLLTARVLASPGSPSTSRLPLARSPISRRSMIASWPMIERPIRCFRSRMVSRAPMLLVEGKDAGPVLLHVHDRPALRERLVERLVELADVRLPVVGPLAVRVGVVHDPHE